MRVFTALALLCLASGCGQQRDSSANTQQLERIAFEQNKFDDIGRTARLQPLGAFAAPADYRGPVCRFTRGADILVYAFGSAAAARIDGTLRTLRAQAPIGPSGGFYRDDELALSIGVESGEQASARITNRLTEAREDAIGVWTCQAPAG
jgi:hypothetical protein